MDYSMHYSRLIYKAKNRVTTAFTETHHILPQCLGGDDSKENLVELTPEEHFVAHQLLAKVHPENPKLAHAAFMMGSTRQNNKLYGWVKRRVADSLRGVPLDEAIKQKMSVAQRNRDPSTRHQLGATFTGKSHSEATRAKMSAAAKGRKKSEESKAAMKAAWERRRLTPVSEETKRKMAAAHKGKKHSQETRVKMSQNSRWKTTPPVS